MSRPLRLLWVTINSSATVGGLSTVLHTARYTFGHTLANGQKQQQQQHQQRSLVNKIGDSSHCPRARTVGLVDMSSTSGDNGVGLSDVGAASVCAAVDAPSTTTPWRERIDVSIAKSRKVRGGNYVQIATVDPTTLEPRCRTVVFRGFLRANDDDDNDAMKMITDKRSRKFAEVTTTGSDGAGKKNTAEMVWWFGKSSEQYRVRGELVFVGEDHNDDGLVTARKQQWGNLSDPAREQFYWRDPETDYEEQEIVPPGGRDDERRVLPPPPNFLLMLLYPRRVDYLRLGDNYRQIDDLKPRGEGGYAWTTHRVNP